MQRPVLPNIVIGGAILTIGLITLISTIFRVDLNIGFWWPIFIVIPGIAMGLAYIFSGRTNNRLIMPSIVLTLYGLTFLLNNIGSVYLGSRVIWATTAFIYPLGLALGFWALWAADKRSIRHLLPAIALSGISIVVFCFSVFTTFLADFLNGNGASSLIAPLLLICLGSAIVFLPLVGRMSVQTSVKSYWDKQNGAKQPNKPLASNASEVVEVEIVKDSN